jgi:flagellar hook-length control protein FliK
MMHAAIAIAPSPTAPVAASSAPASAAGVTPEPAGGGHGFQVLLRAAESATQAAARPAAKTTINMAAASDQPAAAQSPASQRRPVAQPVSEDPATAGEQAGALDAAAAQATDGTPAVGPGTARRAPSPAKVITPPTGKLVIKAHAPGVAVDTADNRGPTVAGAQDAPAAATPAAADLQPPLAAGLAANQAAPPAVAAPLGPLDPPLGTGAAAAIARETGTSRWVNRGPAPAEASSNLPQAPAEPPATSASAATVTLVQAAFSPSAGVGGRSSGATPASGLENVAGTAEALSPASPEQMQAATAVMSDAALRAQSTAGAAIAAATTDRKLTLQALRAASASEPRAALLSDLSGLLQTNGQLEGTQATAPPTGVSATGLSAIGASNTGSAGASSGALVAQQLAPALLSLTQGHGGASQMTLRLNPAELGMVQVQIDRTAAGPASVAITAERPETLQMLRQDQPALQRTLDQAGVPAEGRTVSFHVAQIAGSAASNGTPGFGGSQGNPPSTAPGNQAGSQSGNTPSHPQDDGSTNGGGAGYTMRDQSGNAGGRRPNALPAQTAPADETRSPKWLQVGLDITA